MGSLKDQAVLKKAADTISVYGNLSVHHLTECIDLLDRFPDEKTFEMEGEVFPVYTLIDFYKEVREIILACQT